MEKKILVTLLNEECCFMMKDCIPYPLLASDAVLVISAGDLLMGRKWNEPYYFMQRFTPITVDY